MAETQRIQGISGTGRGLGTDFEPSGTSRRSHSLDKQFPRQMMPPDVDDEFTAFFKEMEPRLSYALAAAYGVEVGRESTSDALAHAGEDWSKLRGMDNPGGYLCRVGQSRARRYRRSGPLRAAS
jgi:hypothetical protein